MKMISFLKTLKDVYKLLTGAVRFVAGDYWYFAFGKMTHVKKKPH